ncbi:MULTISPECIES: glycosyltransferase [unclassified Methanoregula]|uniref:glycosyltransferase n=1 Tax=unclassified Methanoregula TaxID=2649730 RepID=UPI0009D1A413|nr:MULTISPECIES: glycosyltransferase [unclassified Methanoregula]OPX65139.1 MAG: D-inositol-3-phosphate glycosyltransferase [Methanoregula sp. PtaB.Bin085]OPY32051.1 MAG: D-inositol-3-phosphate glycosyltransferase [Methanoregula sp. PtaU1.Bin006]
MTLPTIAIAHQTIVDGDAIGNDILGMYSILRNQGYEVGLIAENLTNDLKGFQLNSRQHDRFMENKNSVLIYHHSVYWKEGEEILNKFKGKTFFKFHNITPPHFFEKYSSFYYEICLQGMRQTDRLLKKFCHSFWWGDSEFNSRQLKAGGLKPEFSLTIPPFTQLEKLKNVEPNFSLIDSLIGNNCNNVLFVGRVAPNKGHIHLMKTLRNYKENYDNKIHLWLVGSMDQQELQLYNIMLLDLIRKYNLKDSISFIDKISEKDLKSYYISCDEFLCMSEHEGFCVPIIEAQKFELPVIAHSGTALLETIGNKQIMFDTFDYDFSASALYTVFSDEKIQDFCRKYGSENVTSRFSQEIIQKKFLTAFQMTGS